MIDSDTGTQPLPRSVTTQVHRCGDLVSITLAGDIDGFTGAPILDVVHASVSCGVNRVVLDMSRVGFLDLGGLRVLLNTHRLSAQRGARLVLRHPAPHVRWLMDLTETTDLLMPDRAEATTHPGVDPLALPGLIVGDGGTGLRKRTERG